VSRDFLARATCFEEPAALDHVPGRDRGLVAWKHLSPEDRFAPFTGREQAGLVLARFWAGGRFTRPVCLSPAAPAACRSAKPIADCAAAPAFPTSCMVRKNWRAPQPGTGRAASVRRTGQFDIVTQMSAS